MCSEATDQELLAAFYFGDDDGALATFVARHRRWALAQAARFFAEEADDIVQLSILRLMDAQPVIEVRNPLGWWRTIIAMTAMDQLRATTRRREQEREAGEVHRLESLYFVSDFVYRIEQAELIKHIHREIDRLDERFRGPLLKRYFEDMSYAEIARVLSLSPGTVASRLSRGIGQVRDALEAGAHRLLLCTTFMTTKTGHLADAVSATSPARPRASSTTRRCSPPRTGAPPRPARRRRPLGEASCVVDTTDPHVVAHPANRA